MVTEEDAARVIGDDVAERDRDENGEATLQVPEGYAIVQSAPLEENLDTSKQAATLVGKHFMYKWPEWGWCHGEVTDVNLDKRRKIGGKIANFKTSYIIDGEAYLASHCLAIESYSCDNDAEYDSWLMLEEAGPA